MGRILAVVISWSMHQSIGWALLHGLCSWAYVTYWASGSLALGIVVGLLQASVAILVAASE